MRTEKINKVNVAEQAHKEIKDMILEGRIKPGERLIQKKLAGKFSLSRTPIIKALERLEIEGLVVSDSKNNFKRVRELSENEIIILFEIRARLEPLAVRYAGKNLSQKLLNKLESACEETYENGDITKYRRANNEFHTAIAEHCANKDLRDITFRLGMLGRFLLTGIVRSMDESFEEHRNIIKYLRSDEIEKAEIAMKEHIVLSLRKLRNKENRGSNDIGG